jgi:uncharacterized alpha-E superfamily protein
LRAVTLKCGGDRQSLQWKTEGCKRTITAYSNAIGVNKATLWLWIQIKTHVFDGLTKNQQLHFKHYAAERAFKLQGKKKITAQKSREIYSRLSNPSDAEVQIDRLVKLASSVRKIIKLYSARLSPQKINKLKSLLTESLQMLG